MEFEKVLAKRHRKIIYKDNDKVIKLFDEGYSKVDILKESLNQAMMEEIGLKVPKVLEVTTIEGKWAIISEYVEGKTIDTLINENPEKQEEYLEKFLNIQLDIHKKRSPLLTKLKDKMNNKIKNSDFESAVKYELCARIESAPTHRCICHGDFNPSNVIIKDNGEVVILDWSHVTEGNASADVARTYLLFCLAGKNDAAEKYLDMFCTSTNTSKAYVQKWIPVVAATQFLKNNPSEKEELSKWINVVEYE